MHTNTSIEYVVVNYRWLFVFLFLLPATLLFELYVQLRMWIVQLSKSASKNHERKVAAIQETVRVMFVN